MVTRIFVLLVLPLAILATACTAEESARGTRSLVLRNFLLVDPESRSVRHADVIIENGRVVEKVAPGREHRVIDGEGRFLLPSLWDVKASLWGNMSALDWKELSQELGITRCLRVQLSYGVAHVVAANMTRDWVKREIDRAQALELDAAEILYPDKALCGPGGMDFACHNLDTPDKVAPLFAELVPRGLTHVLVHYAEPKSDVVPAVSRAVLERALAEAQKRKLPTYVFVDSWERAEEAARFGASALHGLPSGTLSNDLIQLLIDKRVAYSPSLAGYLELPRLLGNRDALSDPFLALTVPPKILATFEKEEGLWANWRRDLVAGETRKAQALLDLERLATAGVRILSASDAGWSAGTFQGYSVHATQEWMERAGLDAWTRLRAATLWPAAFFGRRASFRPGDPADFIALTEDPTRSAGALRAISFLVREGRHVQPDRLRPDVTRAAYGR